MLTATGSVVYPIMFHKLIGPAGFGWTARIIAFVALAGLIFSLAVIKMPLPSPKKPPSPFDLNALRDPIFLISTCGFFFSFMGLYFPLFYLPTYMTSFLHSNGNMAFYIIAILNAASVLGRLTPGLLADHVGSLNTLVPVSLVTSILAFTWIGIRNEAGTIVFACLYGYGSGATLSLMPTVVSRLTSNINTMGTRMGMSFAFAGTGLLIGNPIAGALLDSRYIVFWKAQLFSAVMLMVGAIFFMWVRVLKWRQHEGWKV
jgi:predicted MFS family arabinose efflux permease